MPSMHPPCLSPFVCSKLSQGRHYAANGKGKIPRFRGVAHLVFAWDVAASRYELRVVYARVSRLLPTAKATKSTTKVVLHKKTDPKICCAETNAELMGRGCSHATGPRRLGKKFPSVCVVFVAVVGSHDRVGGVWCCAGEKRVCRMVWASVRGHHPHKS